MAENMYKNGQCDEQQWLWIRWVSDAEELEDDKNHVRVVIICKQLTFI
jgi:hypothetical protein